MIRGIKGHILYTPTPTAFRLHENAILYYEEDHILGIYNTVPKAYKHVLITDYGEAIIIPSFIDLHTHAPQYIQRGLGLDLELMDWLERYTFMLEARFEDTAYAKANYAHFVEDLYQNGTLRSVIYGTTHVPSTLILVDLLKEKGLSAYVGLVQMDRLCPNSLWQDAKTNLEQLEVFLDSPKWHETVKPIITPRFAPSCTADLLEGLGHLSIERHIPVQSHLSETKEEVALVKQQFENAKHYTHVYQMHHLYGEEKTLMAHAIHLESEEIKCAKNPNVFLVHCPLANLNLTSGIMPLVELLDQGIQIGLGTDVGAGHVMGMQQVMVSAIQSAKVRHLLDSRHRLLTEPEAFYLGTKGNGQFFSEGGFQVGSLEPGFQMDALVIQDPHPALNQLTPMEQLQRFLYCGESKSICARYLEGKLLN